MSIGEEEMTKAEKKELISEVLGDDDLDTELTLFLFAKEISEKEGTSAFKVIQDAGKYLQDLPEAKRMELIIREYEESQRKKQDEESEVAYKDAINYFNKERNTIIENIVSELDFLPSKLLTKQIKSEQDLKEFTKSVIMEMIKSRGSDLEKLAALEEDIRKGLNESGSMAFSEVDKEDLLDLVAMARKEVITRNAIDKVIGALFKKNDFVFIDLNKRFNSPLRQGYAEAAINRMITLCDRNNEKLTELEENVRKFLNEGPNLPIESLEAEKERLIGLVTTAKSKLK